MGDSKIIEEIINELNGEYRRHISVVKYLGDIDKFLNEFSSMEDIVATRFHACILSQVFEQGLFTIIYSDKTYNVLRDIQLDDYYCYIKDICNLNIDSILKSISLNKIKDKNILKRSECQFDKLDEFLK